MQKSFPKFFFLLLLLLVTAAFFGLIIGFLMAVFWAIVFAILFHDRYEKFKNHFKGNRNLAATVTLLMVILMVIIPLSIVGTVTVYEASKYYQEINDNDATFREQIIALQDKIPLDDSKLSKYGLSIEKIQSTLADFFSKTGETIGRLALGVSQNLFGFFINFFLMLYTLFFFLRDGKKLVQELVWVLPIGDEQEWTLLNRFESVARATVKGSLLVAFVQGVIGGILFWTVGIPAAFLWGVLMILASLLPVGSALIWVPAASILFIQGEIGRAIAVVIVGALLIGLIDNFLRPRLVGQDTKMPDYLILLSTLGGLAWFGLSGFVIGPIIAALFVTCWQMLGKEYGNPYDEVVTEGTVENIGEIEVVKTEDTEEEI